MTNTKSFLRRLNKYKSKSLLNYLKKNDADYSLEDITELSFDESSKKTLNFFMKRLNWASKIFEKYSDASGNHTQIDTDFKLKLAVYALKDAYELADLIAEDSIDQYSDIIDYSKIYHKIIANNDSPQNMKAIFTEHLIPISKFCEFVANTLDCYMM